MNKIKTDGIIFDMDGTIWDNTPVFAPAWSRAAKDSGYDIVFEPSDLKKLFGKTMRDIADAAVPDEDPEKRYAVVKKAEIYEMDDLAKSPEDTTYAGLMDTLRSLSKRTKLFIVSNCQQGYIETFLEKYDAGKYFTDYVCYGDNGLAKGDNIAGLVAKNKIDHPVYIGDIQSDKDACDKAGIDFIWAKYGYGDSVDSYLAAVDDIRQLDEIIE